MIDNEQGGFRAGRGCVDQIFTLKQIPRRHKKNCKVYVGCVDLEKVYNRVNMETLWQMLRMYDVGSKLFSRIKSIYEGDKNVHRILM